MSLKIHLEIRDMSAEYNKGDTAAPNFFKEFVPENFAVPLFSLLLRIYLKLRLHLRSFACRIGMLEIMLALPILNAQDTAVWTIYFTSASVHVTKVPKAQLSTSRQDRDQSWQEWAQSLRSLPVSFHQLIMSIWAGTEYYTYRSPNFILWVCDFLIIRIVSVQFFILTQDRLFNILFSPLEIPHSQSESRFFRWRLLSGIDFPKQWAFQQLWVKSSPGRGKPKDKWLIRNIGK